MKVPVFLILSVCMFALASTPLPAQQHLSKMDLELYRAFQHREGIERYLVQLGKQPDLDWIDPAHAKKEKGQLVYKTLKAHAQQTQSGLIEFLENRHIPHRPYYLVNAILVESDYDTALKIARLAQVEKLVYDPVIQQSQGRVAEDRVNPRGGAEPEWGILGIQADRVWEMGFTGGGVVVGGADTGVEWVHSTIRDQYRGNLGDTVIHAYSWHDAIHELSPLHQDTSNDASNNPCGLEVDFPCDDNNHGTHTIGTILGTDTANLIGVAPGAKWIACRNMERGWGSPSTYLECFEWFLAPTDLAGENPDPDLAPDVINNSWRCPEIEGCNESNYGLIQEAVRALKQAGIFVVASAGNEGPGCFSIDAPPAIFEESFSVGAHASNDTIANFSSRGPIPLDTQLQVKPDIVAPGVGVRSAIRNQGFAHFSGTSMAGPHVAGAVALMISANPELRGQVELIESLLINSAIPVTSTQDCDETEGSLVPNNTYGHGLLDAFRAVEAARNLAVHTKEVNRGEEVALFPNPARQVIHWVTDQEKVSTYRVFNLGGQLVLEGDANGRSSGQVDLSGVEPGIYVIHFQGLDHPLTGKISIVR